MSGVRIGMDLIVLLPKKTPKDLLLVPTVCFAVAVYAIMRGTAV